MENFLYTFQVCDKVCDDLIQYHNDNTEYKTSGTFGDNSQIDTQVKESTDVAFYNSSSAKPVTNYFAELQKGYNEYTEKFNIQSLKLSAENSHYIQYYPPNGGFKQWHWERHNSSRDRQLVYMTYLNDVTDKGGTEWLYQNFKLDAKKGLSVIWPADLLIEALYQLHRKNGLLQDGFRILILRLAD